MEQKCRNCRWWYRKKLKQEGHICGCDTSDSFGEFTDEDLSCKKWLPQLEQDGNATWYME